MRMASSKLIFLFSCFPLFFCSVVNGKTKVKENSKSLEFSMLHSTKDCPKLALLFYDQQSKKIESNFGRQYNQTLTLIKSILITMEKDDCVHIILISNKKMHFKKLKNEVYTWDLLFTSKIEFEFVRHKYPKERKWMHNIYRPGSTFGIFLADILPYDSVIYTDTDVLFLRSITELWLQMNNFSSTALASACIRLMPISFIDIPVIHETGLGAGVMLMNLTRMRERNWSDKVVMETIPFLQNIKFGLEDFLNVYFYKFPEDVRLLSCDWNYWFHRCKVPCPDEDEGIKGGISIIHGNTCTFMDPETEPIFRFVYQAFANTTLDGNFELEDLVQKLEGGISIQRSVYPESLCAKSTNFDYLVLKRLKQKLVSDKHV